LKKDLEKLTSDAGRSHSLHDEDQRKLENLEKLLGEVQDRLKEEQKTNDQLRGKVGDDITSDQVMTSALTPLTTIQMLSLENLLSSSSGVDTSQLQRDVDELTSRIEVAEDEKKEAIKKLDVLTVIMHFALSGLHVKVSVTTVGCICDLKTSVLV